MRSRHSGRRKNANASSWLPRLAPGLVCLVLLAPALLLAGSASAGTKYFTVSTFTGGQSSRDIDFTSCQSSDNSTTVTLPFDANVTAASLRVAYSNASVNGSHFVAADVGDDGSFEANVTFGGNSTFATMNVGGGSFNNYTAALNLTSGNVSVPIRFLTCAPSGGWTLTFYSLSVRYFLVIPANTSTPSFSGPIGNLQLRVNASDPSMVYLPSYFSEPDNDTLTYSLVKGNASDPGWANVSATFGPSYLGFNATAGWTGNLTFRVRATDPANLSANSNVVNLEVYTNRAPSFNGTLPNYTVTVNLSKSVYTNLASYFTDPDYNDTPTFSVVPVNASDPGWANVTVNVSQGYFVFSSSNGWMGNLSFRVRGTDGAGAFAESNNLTLTVRANEAPVFSGPMNDVIVGINSSTSASSSYFTEPDGEPMTISFAKGNPNATGWANVTVTGLNGSQNLSAGIFYVTTSGGWSGNLTGFLHAVDASGLATDGNTFTIVVNGLPELHYNDTRFFPIYRGEMNYAVVNLSENFSDPEGDPLTFFANLWYCGVCGNNTSAPVDVIVNGSFLDFDSTSPTFTGLIGFTVYTCDGYSRCVGVFAFYVDVVIRPNRAPVFSGSLADLYVIEGLSNLSVYDFGPSFSDPDGDALLFAVAKVDANATGWLYVQVLFNGTRIGVRSTSTSWEGTLDIAISARDPSVSYAWSNNFTIHVLSRDLRPVFSGPIDNLTLPVGGTLADAFDANDFFADPNGLPLTFAIVNASVSDGWNTTAVWLNNGSFLSAANDGTSSWTGAVCFAIRATDVNGSTQSSNEFCLRVVAPTNAPPAPTQSLPVLRVVGGASGEVLLDLSQYFSDDRFANELTFAVVEGAEPAWSEVNLSVSGSTLKVTFEGAVPPTNLTLYIVVTDTWGAIYTSPPVRLEVASNPVNHAPQVEGPGPVTLALGTSLRLGVAAFDADNDALTWTVVTSAPGLSAAVDGAAGMVTLSASTLDERIPYEAVVWVTDAWGATSEVRIPVTVWNPAIVPSIALSLSANRAGAAWVNGTVTMGAQPASPGAFFATVSLASVGGPAFRAAVVDGRFALQWPNALQPGFFAVTVSVTDGYGRVGTANELLTVPDPLPAVPTLLGILLNGAQPAEVDAGSTFSLNLLASTSIPAGVTVEWFIDGGKVGEGATLAGLTASPGIHTLEARASNGEVSRNVSASLSVREPARPPVQTTSAPFPPVLALAILATVTIGLAFGFTQRGQYLLFAGLIGSIFARLKRESLLDHFIRGRLYQVISEEPGIHLAELRRRTQTAHGTAIHHLHILEKGRYIRAEPSGALTRFFPTDQPFEHDAYGITDGDRAVLSVVAGDPGITQGELSNRLGRSPSAVSRSVTRLNNLGYVTTEQKGRFVSVYPRPGAVIEGDSAGGGWQDEHA